MRHRITLVWLRQDLRLHDHPALHQAAQTGAVVPVYIWAPEEEGRWPCGAASRWWLHQSLKALDKALREKGSRLILRRGPSLKTLRTLVKETGATSVVWSRRYEPAAVARDAKIKTALTTDGLHGESFNSALLYEPWEIRNNAGQPFQVFTQFWRKCQATKEPAAPLPAPRILQAPAKWPRSEPLENLRLEPRIQWAGGIRAAWTPGPVGAAAELKRFLGKALVDYPEARNRPDVSGSSRLSPHLHFGALSPRQVWSAIKKKTTAGGHGLVQAEERYLAEIGWRDFSHALIFNFPHTPERCLRKHFDRFPWKPDARLLKAWQCGRTGYPFVDAGMRELWSTGWMHNRVRMVVASFLVKHLLQPWQRGAEWFWDTLVDADLANNTMGWQWTAGCGADAAPFFRIFNPVTQGEKFDPAGAYVRKWVPEIAKLPKEFIHRPWEAPPLLHADCGIVMGETYPWPVVDHKLAREAALDAFEQVKR